MTGLSLLLPPPLPPPLPLLSSPSLLSSLSSRLLSLQPPPHTLLLTVNFNYPLSCSSSIHSATYRSSIKSMSIPLPNKTQLQKTLTLSSKNPTSNSKTIKSVIRRRSTNNRYKHTQIRKSNICRI